MKTIKWIALLLAVCCLAGCAPAAEQQAETVRETVAMNNELVEMVKNAVGCSSFRAEAILEIMQEITPAEPVAVYPGEGEGDPVVIETADGKRYAVSLDKKFSVYCVRDLETGEYLYAVFE